MSNQNELHPMLEKILGKPFIPSNNLPDRTEPRTIEIHVGMRRFKFTTLKRFSFGLFARILNRHLKDAKVHKNSIIFEPLILKELWILSYFQVGDATLKEIQVFFLEFLEVLRSFVSQEEARKFAQEINETFCLLKKDLNLIMKSPYKRGLPTTHVFVKYGKMYTHYRMNRTGINMEEVFNDQLLQHDIPFDYYVSSDPDPVNYYCLNKLGDDFIKDFELVKVGKVKSAYYTTLLVFEDENRLPAFVSANIKMDVDSSRVYRLVSDIAGKPVSKLKLADNARFLNLVHEEVISANIVILSFDQLLKSIKKNED